MPERMRATIPVFLCLLGRRDTVYLQRRFNTGYMDGYWEPPAGKTDDGEFPPDAACREAYEESGVVVNAADVELFHSYMNLTNNKPWLGLMFRTHRWQGIPSIQEPTKCDAAGFFELEALPDVTPQVRDGLARVATASTIEMSLYGDVS